MRRTGCLMILYLQIKGLGLVQNWGESRPPYSGLVRIRRLAGDLADLLQAGLAGLDPRWVCAEP